MSIDPDHRHHEIPELEFDEDIAPRPEEEAADVGRAVPDLEPHRTAPPSE